MTTPTLQTVFDTVSSHLLAQNKRSRDKDDLGCVYRGVGGLKCAVGCLIADEHYTPKLEDVPVVAPRVEAALWKSIDPQGLMPPEERAPLIALLGKLQRIHDLYQPQHWPERLNALAEVFNLKPPKEVTL